MINLPVVINDMPTRNKLRATQRIEMVSIALRVAKNIHMRCRLAESQNWKCCWCGIVCVPESNHGNSATIEHVKCRSQGGADVWENYAMACNKCNSRRGNSSVDVFMKRLSSKTNKKKKNKGETRKVVNSRKRFEKDILGGLKLASCGWVTKSGKHIPIEEWISLLGWRPEKELELRKRLEIGIVLMT